MSDTIVFIPAWNEEQSLPAVLDELRTGLPAVDVLVVDDFKLTSAKSKEFVGVLRTLDVNGTALIVASGDNKNLQLASRNVANVELATGENHNTYQVLKCHKLLFTRGAKKRRRTPDCRSTYSSSVRR